MALTADRNTPRAEGDIQSYPVLAAAVCFAGGIAVLDSSGWAKPGVTATGLVCAGRFEEYVSNTGDSGDVNVRVRAGVFQYANSGSSDEITQAEVGDNAYIVDDATVAKTSGGATRSIAGRIMAVDAQGVWVAMGFGVTNAPGGALLAANNLSDVGTAATARASIGANKGSLRIGVSDLTGTGVFRTIAPRAGTFTKIYSVIDGALATGNATLTGKIGAVAITNGVIAITQAGSAAGDVDSATPTAANAFVAGDVISMTVGGTNSDEDATAEVVLEFTY